MGMCLPPTEMDHRLILEGLLEVLMSSVAAPKGVTTVPRPQAIGCIRNIPLHQAYRGLRPRLEAIDVFRKELLTSAQPY